MSEQTDNIVKQLKRDANDSRKVFLEELIIKVQSVIDENLQNKEFLNAVDLFQSKSESLGKIDDIAANITQLQSMTNKTEVEEIKNSIISSHEVIDSIKSSLSDVQTSVATGCKKTDEIILKFDELKTVAQDEDLKKVIELTENSKTALSDISENATHQNEQIENVKNNTKDILSEIDMVLQTINSKSESIDKVDEIANKISVLDELPKKGKADEIHSLLTNVQTSVATGCEKTDDIILKFDELKTVAQDEDVKKVIEATESTKSTLSKISKNVNCQNEQIDGIKSDTKNILSNVEIVLQNVSSEKFTEIREKLNNQILSLSQIIEANNSLVEKVEYIQKEIDNADIVEIGKIISSNKTCLERIEENTKILFDETEKNSFVGLKKELISKIKLLYWMNAATMAGLVLLIILFLVK